VRSVGARGYLANQFGVSDLTGWAEFSCFARLVPLTGVVDEMGGAQVFYTVAWVLGDQFYWDVTFFNPGDRKQFTFVSSQAYPADTVMMLIMGTGLFHGAWVDDVAFQNVISSNWTISGTVGQQI
jgi:hypothetical protein